MDGSLHQFLYSQIEKNDLSKYCLTEHPIQLLYLLLQIARGIEKLHSERIMHRDIKSENVLIKLRKHNENIILNSVKISDFGIINEGTKCFSSVGTDRYAAPGISSKFELIY